jgi:hypothetical protein
MAHLMLESFYAEMDGRNTMPLVDLGYCGKDAFARMRAVEALSIARRNFQIVGADRLFVRIPKTKVAAVLASLPIVEGETYWRATHHWRGLGARERKARVPPFPASLSEKGETE